MLGIPDNYEYMDPALGELLKKKVEPFLVGSAPNVPVSQNWEDA